MSTSYGYQCRTHGIHAIVGNLRAKWIPLLECLLKIKQANPSVDVFAPLDGFGGGDAGEVSDFLEEHHACAVVIANEYGEAVDEHGDTVAASSEVPT